MKKLTADVVKETTTTAGTGTVTLTQSTGWVRFSDRFTDGDRVQYSIRDGANWEVGVGTYVAPNQLARTAIVGTLNAGTYTAGGSPLTLSGSATVRAVLSEWFLTDLPRVAPLDVVGSQAVDNGGSYRVTVNSVTLTLPAAPTAGDRMEIMQGAAGITGTVINPNGGKINNTSGNMSVDIDNFAFGLVYVGASYGWKVI